MKTIEREWGGAHPKRSLKFPPTRFLKFLTLFANTEQSFCFIFDEIDRFFVFSSSDWIFASLYSPLSCVCDAGVCTVHLSVGLGLCAGYVPVRAGDLPQLPSSSASPPRMEPGACHLGSTGWQEALGSPRLHQPHRGYRCSLLNMGLHVCRMCTLSTESSLTFAVYFHPVFLPSFPSR